MDNILNFFFLEFTGIEQFIEYVNARSHLVPSVYTGKMNSEVVHFLLGSSYSTTTNAGFPFFVSNYCNVYSNLLKFRCDIDSYAYIGTGIPVLRTLGLVLRPVYTKSYRHNTRVTWSNKKYTNNIRVGAHSIPNIHFMESQDISVSRLIFSFSFLTSFRYVFFSLDCTRILNWVMTKIVPLE